MLYTFAGTSVTKGAVKVRFANSEARSKQLAKLGDTDVNIVPLPSAMDKAGAVCYLQNLAGFADTDAVREALAGEVAVKTRPAKTAKKHLTKTIRVKTAKPARARRTEPVVVTQAEVDALMAAVFGVR